MTYQLSIHLMDHMSIKGCIVIIKYQVRRETESKEERQLCSHLLFSCFI